MRPPLGLTRKGRKRLHREPPHEHYWHTLPGSSFWHCDCGQASTFLPRLEKFELKSTLEHFEPANSSKPGKLRK